MRGAGHEVDLIDLIEDGFNPVMTKDDLAGWRLKSVVDPVAADCSGVSWRPTTSSSPSPSGGSPCRQGPRASSTLHFAVGEPHAARSGGE